MEPNESESLDDRELSELLREWQVPAAPAHLRTQLFPDRNRQWWRNLWKASIRIPVPVAACLVLLIALGAWKIERRLSPTDVKGMQMVERTAAPSFYGLQPVAELRPRIIRSPHAEN